MEEIVTGEAVVLDLPYARFPTRMLAHLIDMFLQLVVLGAVSIVVAVGAATRSMNDASLAAVLITSMVAVTVGYPAASESLSRGRTVGKLALGLRVVADDGGPERFRQALLRALAGSVECWLLIGVPALITAMLSARGKRLGDIFAGTFVIRERAPRAAQGAYLAGGYGAGPWQPAVDPALSAWASALDLSGLPEQAAASAASYLARYWQLNAPVRDELGARLAADIAARVTPPPPHGLPPVAYLQTVLAERRDRELTRLRAASAPGPATAARMPSPAEQPLAGQPAEPPPAAVPSPGDSGFAPPM